LLLSFFVGEGTADAGQRASHNPKKIKKRYKSDSIFTIVFEREKLQKMWTKKLSKSIQKGIQKTDPQKNHKKITFSLTSATAGP
jgi:hypothetical protein